MLHPMKKPKPPTTPHLPAASAHNRASETLPLATEPSAPRQRLVWVLALGTAALWQLDPAFAEMANMVAATACAGNKSMARDAIAQMRAQADDLRARIAPLPASALAKVVRRAEAACGAVLDKGVRVREVQDSWHLFETCVRAPRDPKT